ncbi:hypothetical protein HAX54_025791, partial [Datura stramonium]|nr:hypothetical protein [Datura stramonium]
VGRGAGEVHRTVHSAESRAQRAGIAGAAQRSMRLDSSPDLLLARLRIRTFIPRAPF